jgi:hypothetical protein
MEVDRDSGSFDVALTLDGYQVARRSVTTDDDREINVTLAAKEVVPPPAPAQPKAKPHVASSSHHGKPTKSSKPTLDDGLLPSTLLK